MDVRVLRVVRRFLETGLLKNGLERERRGHAFCRYADDCYIKSLRAGERVMASS